MKVTVTLRDGSEIYHVVRYATGTPENPMSDQELRDKFHRLAGQRIPEDRMGQLEEFIDQLDVDDRPLDMRPFAVSAHEDRA